VEAKRGTLEMREGGTFVERGVGGAIFGSKVVKKTLDDLGDGG